MGTTKDPEGFRRHSSGRRQVLGEHPEEAPRRRGCGLGAVLVVVGLGLGAALLWSGGDRDGRALTAATAPPAPVAEAPGAALELVDTRPEARRDTAPDGAPVRAAGTTERSEASATDASGPAPSFASGDLQLRLLRGWSDVPMAGAEVFWLGRGELERLQREGLTISTVALAPTLYERGRHVRSNAGGRMGVAPDGAHLLVVGDDWKREIEVVPSPARPLDVRVFAPRTLVVDVVDWRGRPVPAFPVEFWRVDVAGEPRTWVYRTRTSLASGGLRLEDVDRVLQSGMELESNDQERPALERTKVRVELDRDLAPAGWQVIDLVSDPLPRVRLQLPPLGELDVRVEGVDGLPVTWDGRVEVRDDAGRGFPNTNSPEVRSIGLRDGRAHFSNLPFDRALRIHVLRTEGAKEAPGEERVLAPLTPDEPVREVVLPDVPASPRLFARPVLPEGGALAGAWVGIRVQVRRPLRDDERSRLERQLEGRFSNVSGRSPIPVPPAREIPTHTTDSWTRVLRCDARGMLEVPLPESLLAAEEGRLRLSLERDGKTLTSQTVELERGAAWADLDLGPVVLREPD